MQKGIPVSVGSSSIRWLFLRTINILLGFCESYSNTHNCFGNPLTLELQNPRLWPKHPGKSLWLCSILQNMAYCGLSFLLSSTPKKSGWKDLPYNTVCRVHSNCLCSSVPCKGAVMSVPSSDHRCSQPN